MYTIGQVAEMFGLPVSTLRYYDKQGLFPELERTSGIRRFGDTELEALRVIECLKKAGMEIKPCRSLSAFRADARSQRCGPLPAHHWRRHPPASRNCRSFEDLRRLSKPFCPLRNTPCTPRLVDENKGNT